MTTLAGARAELQTALNTASIRATSAPGLDPPYVLLAGGGIDPEHIVRGQALASFRCILIAGAWDDEAAAASLDALKLGTLEVLRELPSWQLGTLGSDGLRSFTGGDYLSAEWSASRYIDIP